MCITDRHDMTLAVQVALNPNTTNQLNPRQLAAFLHNHDHNKDQPRFEGEMNLIAVANNKSYQG